MARKQDVDLFFQWANDKTARENSYNPSEIPYDQHLRWFESQVDASECLLFVFVNEYEQPVGQVRIEMKNMAQPPAATISISVDVNHRGNNYSSEMIRTSSDAFLTTHPDFRILAYIFKTNKSSYSSFIKAGFQVFKEEIVNGKDSYILSLNK